MSQESIGTLSDVRGQEAALGVLASALTSSRVPHAYLFVGPEGVGKAKAARLWAQILLCEAPVSPVQACGQCVGCRKAVAGGHPDLLSVDFERQAALLKEPLEKQKSIKIDTVREMEHTLRLKPSEARVKVALLDPADALVDAAAHALLKILEEPPAATHLVLIAREATALLPTIRSRCHLVRFRPLDQVTLAEIVRGLKPGVSEAETRTAATVAEGSVARALAAIDGSGALDFDWTSVPLSELLAWCEGFGNPRLGRSAAERLVESLMAREQESLRRGEGSAEALRESLTALHRLRQNAHVTLTLQTLLLGLRRRAREKAEARPSRDGLAPLGSAAAGTGHEPRASTGGLDPGPRPGTSKEPL